MAKFREAPQALEWTELQREFLCPDTLWQGVWGEVADLVGRSWDVWMAVYIALNAIAGRNLWWYYYRAPVYGMAYGLVVAPTGAGKEFCLNVASALLPEDYKIREGVQSGQGLFPLLCDTKAKQAIKPATPVLLLLSEWTTIPTMGRVQHSTLIGDLNTVFHRPRGWNLNRSDRETSGGDRTMGPPVLSILGTTTPEDLRETVDDALVNKGFMNRYLILPGPMKPWQFWPETGKIDDPQLVLQPLRERLNTTLRGYTSGQGKDYQTAFTTEAQEAWRGWGEKLFPQLMVQGSVQANRKKRLHLYGHQIALLSAWSQQSPVVTGADAAMAAAVVDASNRFIDRLWATEDIPLSITEQGDFRLEQAILARVKERPDYYDKKRFGESLRRQGAPYAKITKALDQLAKANLILLNPDTMRYVLADERDGRGAPPLRELQ